MQLESGVVFGGAYRLEKMLGKGGMGEVWLARHILLDELRAIKLVLGTFANNSDIRDRFIKGEARNSLRLGQHPNIVRVFELGLYEDSPYIVMEFIEGGPFGVDLRQLIRSRGKLQVEEVGFFLDGIVAGLEVAHQLGLIHRDIKPANILIDKSGQPKLSDFGLTKDLESDADLTATGFSMGSPTYMSPEQAQGRAERASDIYSLGGILYEALTGRPPFVGSTTSLLVQHATTPPPPPQEFEPSVPGPVATVILRALAKNPSDRYSTATALAMAYRQAVKAGKGVADETNPEEPTQTIALSTSVSQLPGGAKTAQSAPTIAPPQIPNNLPEQLNSFVGRTAERAQARLLLQNTRLLTLMGAGGTGKTRLSIEVAKDLLPEFPDGIWFVELAPLNEADLLEQTLANVLDVREEPGRPLLKTLTEYLKDKQALIILDNCEHLILASAKLAESLIRGCPKLRILASSREALAINGETTWRVPSLSVPDPQQLPPLVQLTQYAAVKLFIDRATAAQPNFQVTNQNAPAVAQICYQLDGIPLAIELAAARIKGMTAEQIASRLDNSFRLLTGGSRTALPRQQTLRALIDWSYDLLPEPERVLLERLSVFAGGWGLEAVELVCAGDYAEGSIEDFEVLDLLLQLVNKSLVVADEQGAETRYRLLETIRQYGSEKLKTRGEAAQVRSKHCTYYLELAEKAELELQGPQQTAWLARLATEHDNLRAALTWAAEDANDPARVEIALRFGGALWRFWAGRGFLSESRQRLETVIRNVRSLSDTSSIAAVNRVKALNAAGVIAYRQRDFVNARQYYEDGLALAHTINDKFSTARLLNNLGMVAHHQEDYKAARSAYEQSLALFRELNNREEAGLLLNNLGLAARDQGDYQAAELFLAESLATQRTLGNKNGVALALSTLGDVKLDQQDHSAAQSFLAQSLTMFHELGDREMIAYSLEFFGGLAAAENQFERAFRLAAAADAIRQELGAPLSNPEQATLMRRLSAARQGLGEVGWQAAWQAGLQLGLEPAVTYALEK